MPIIIRVAGVDRSDKRLSSASLTWQDQLNGRGTLSITFRDVVGGWRPLDGQEVLILRNAPVGIVTKDGAEIRTSDGAPILSGPSRLFGGILQEPSEWIEPGSDGVEANGTPIPPTIFYESSAAEFSAICDRRLVSRIYESMPLGAIVRDIVREDLDGEGINAWGVPAAGPVIEKAVFSDVTVTQAFNELAELAGMSWRVDAYRVLWFYEWGASVAPIALNSSTLLAGSVKVRPSREKYRNVQLVKAGTDLTDPRTETLVGDGARRAFSTTFPLGSVPAVEVSRAGGAWVAETVGILGVDVGMAWSWNSGQSQVSQSDSGTILAAPTSPSNPASGDRVRITYRGIFPVKTSYQNTEEIAARAAIEGGSGIYANVEDKPAINSAASAIATAVALIERYGRIGKTLTARTREADFEPGQVAVVTLPEHNLNGVEMLIDSVAAEYVQTGEDADGDVGEVWYQLTALEGDPWGGWQDYFRKLISSSRKMVIEREGEILVLLRAAEEAVTCSAAVVRTSEVPESRIGYLLVGTGEIGAP